jgi:hypothetical protein
MTQTVGSLSISSSKPSRRASKRRSSCPGFDAEATELLPCVATALGINNSCLRTAPDFKTWFNFASDLTTKLLPFLSEKDLREEKSNLLDSMELDGDKGVTAANPWKSVAIGSEKKNGNEGLERKVYEFICL